MTSIRYIIAISCLTVAVHAKLSACGPYYPENPADIYMFRACSPTLGKQWLEGCRFQDYEKEQNCLLWQRITSRDIPCRDIEQIVYEAKLKDLNNLNSEKWPDNKFLKWLLLDKNKEDLDYLLVAKEIEEIREYMNNPWYFAYDGDEEHVRLNELQDICRQYSGKRHAARYGLQLMRLNFANKDFPNCIDLWEETLSELPHDVITDMAASYAAGAYYRGGNRNKAVELYTRSQDIGSLINLKEWDEAETNSKYNNERIKELEYIFNRFPNSPLLSLRLQEYVRDRESFLINYADWEARGFHDPVCVKTNRVDGALVADDDKSFYDELKKFAGEVVASGRSEQNGMWLYALAYLAYLDKDLVTATAYLNRAGNSSPSPFIKESIDAFRILLDSYSANNSRQSQKRLLKNLQWLDERMISDINKNCREHWQYDNKLNYSFYYWQDVARKVLLGEMCGRMQKEGNTVLALQLANYATNRIYQISPLYEIVHYGWADDDPESYSRIMPFDEYRTKWKGWNSFDYCSGFFDVINSVPASDAEAYAKRLLNPVTDLDKFLNDRSYTDGDYIFDIVGTLYLREMNYAKAVEWLSKVSTGYQARTNIAKEGYFRHDPFQYQSNKKHYIDDSSDYKLRFAQEMLQLDQLINSDAEPNRKANAKLRYAKGLRNSFGNCWYLTRYGYSFGYSYDPENESAEWFDSGCREGFKDDEFAQMAYEKSDALTIQAISEFTDSDQAAEALLEMMNFKTLVTEYPESKAAEFIRGRCDNYHDYALQNK